MGALKGLLRLNIGLVLFLGGYSFCRYINNDRRYSLARINEQPYLIDKLRHERLQIDEEKLQVGSLEYRLLGILQEKSLPQALESLKYKVLKNE